jgi:hypothetical protein
MELRRLLFCDMIFVTLLLGRGDVPKIYLRSLSWDPGRVSCRECFITVTATAIDFVWIAFGIPSCGKDFCLPGPFFVSCEQGDPAASLGIVLPCCPSNSFRSTVCTSRPFIIAVPASLTIAPACNTPTGARTTISPEYVFLRPVYVTPGLHLQLAMVCPLPPKAMSGNHTTLHPNPCPAGQAWLMRFLWSGR